MLRLHPDKRAKATDLIHHNFLDGVVVQGEIDVIRRAEQDEIARRRVLGIPSSTSQTQPTSPTRTSDKRGLLMMEQSERDAMKPVGEVVTNGDGDDDDVEEDEQPPQPQGQVQPGYQGPILQAPPTPSSAAGKENGRGQANPNGNASGLTRALQTHGSTAAPVSPPTSKARKQGKGGQGKKK